MKFTFDNKEDKDCVAYLNGDYLIINDEEWGPVALSKLGVGKNTMWKPTEATKKFYEGDSITITF